MVRRELNLIKIQVRIIISQSFQFLLFFSYSNHFLLQFLIAIEIVAIMRPFFSIWQPPISLLREILNFLPPESRAFFLLLASGRFLYLLEHLILSTFDFDCWLMWSF